MASLDIGNLAGAAAGLTTAFSKEKSIKSFIKQINNFGVQVKNNFEVNFSGLQDIMFFLTDISVPGIKTNWTTLNYNGRVVDVPINYDYDHAFSMTVLNDAQGYIYSALTNFMIKETGSDLAKGGYTMTIKALTGDHKHYKGALLTMKGVRFETIGGLQFGYSDNAVSTFSVNGKLIEFTYTPGALQTPAGIIGSAVSMLKG